MLKEGDIPVLNQLVERIEKLSGNMKEAYEKKDAEKFNKAKKELLQSQKEFLEKIQ